MCMYYMITAWHTCMDPGRNVGQLQILIWTILGSKCQKFNAGLPAGEFLTLDPAKNMSKQPFFEEKWANYECFCGLREHAVRSNPVSEGSKAFDPNIIGFNYKGFVGTWQVISRKTCVFREKRIFKFLNAHIINGCVYPISHKLLF